MKLISRSNPEAVTLKAGSPLGNPLVPDLNQAEAVEVGVIYWAAYPGLDFTPYRNLDARATFINVDASKAFGETFSIATQPATVRDQLWAHDGDNMGRYRALDDGNISAPLLLFDDGRIVDQLTQAYRTPLLFKVDGNMMYVADVSGTDVVARAFRIDESAILRTSEPLERVAALDLELGANPNVADFDIKTIAGVRHASVLLFANSKNSLVRIVGDSRATAIDDIAQVAANIRTRVMIDSSIVGDVRNAIASAIYTPQSSTAFVRDIAVYWSDVDGPASDAALLEPARSIEFSAAPSGFTPRIRAATSAALIQFDRPQNPVPYPSTAKTLATRINESAARLTEAVATDGGGSVFRERREISVEISLREIEAEFLLNENWYFEHNDLTYIMLEHLTESGTTIATFRVI